MQFAIKTEFLEAFREGIESPRNLHVTNLPSDFPVFKAAPPQYAAKRAAPGVKTPRARRFFNSCRRRSGRILWP